MREAYILLLFVLHVVQGLENLCSITNCVATNHANGCTSTVTFNFWAGSEIYPSPYIVNGLIQRLPDKCQPGFEPFDGRCYGHSLGLLGTPVANGGLGKSPEIAWNNAEQICTSYSADAYYGGCHLTSIHTPRENCFVYELMKTNPYYINTDPRAVRDNRGFNDYNGCHSNKRGSGVYAGTCWIGLDQNSGEVGTLYVWKDGTRYDRRPRRNGGFTPWAGAAASTVCFSEVTGEMNLNCGYYFEPNNIYGGTEDCTQIWDRRTSSGEWNDEPCTYTYPYVCSKVANCQPGYFRSVVYKGMPVRKTSIQDFGVDDSYTPGLCTECAAGTYNPQDSALNYESTCFSCPEGRYGVKGEFKTDCTDICPRGKYCPSGTGVNAIPLCQAGTFSNSLGLVSQVDCTTTSPGYFALAGATAQSACNAGRCGYSGAVDATCQDPCPAGYSCSSGTGCFNQTVTPALLPVPCGENKKYAPSGTPNTCLVALDGQYTYGQTATTRTNVAPCSPGNWCKNGVQTKCLAGKYNDLTGQSSADACLTCSAGYLCYAGSTSPIQQVCYKDNPQNATMYYCPAGATAPVVVSPNHYTIPADGSNQTRTGQLPCQSHQICVNGVAIDKLTWAPSACSLLQVAENRQTPNISLIQAVLNPNLPLVYSIKYSLMDFTLAPDLIPSLGSGPCNPVGKIAPYSNAGIFKLDSASGMLSVTRTTFPNWLDYEPTDANGLSCLDGGIRYELTVRAVATGEGSNSTLECKVPVEILDQNDRPQWKPAYGSSTLYRTIGEKSPLNTAVGRCDASSAYYGCPVVHNPSDDVELQAKDPDCCSVLRYSFAPDRGSALAFPTPESNPFRINSCSGLISMRLDKAISYDVSKVFNFTVRVQDDGNGGRFPLLDANVSVVIFITDEPDPPTLRDSLFYNFTVKENEPSGQVIGSVLATDPDVGSVITYSLENPNSGDAVNFQMVGNTIMTNLVGSQTIDFETLKTTYTISIRAMDNDQLFDVKSYTIRVVNTNDPPTFVEVAPFYILENSNDSSPVCSQNTGVCPVPGPNDRVKVIDVDSGPSDITNYALIGGRTDLFTIDLLTGVIRTKVGAKASLNFENELLSDLLYTGRKFSVTVQVTSTGVVPASKSQVYDIYLVDVNEPPVITLVADYFVLEGAPVTSACDPLDGSNPSLLATDPDNADLSLKGNAAPVQTVTFSRDTSMSHPSLHDGGNLFSLFSTGNGMAAVQTSGTIDFETAPVGGLACGLGSTANSRCYKIYVKVTDNGAPLATFDSKIVTIQVIDVNDGPNFVQPFIRTISVSESISSASQVVGAVYSATDADLSPSLSFTLLESSGMNYFDIVPAASSFQVSKKNGVLFDFESSQTSFVLTVEVKDGQSSKLIGSSCGPIPSGCDAGSVCQQKTGPFRTELRCFELCRPVVEAVVVPRKFTYFCDYTGLTPTGVAYSQAGDSAMTLNVEITDYNDNPYIVDFDGIAGNAGCFVNGTVSSNKGTLVQIALAGLNVVDQDVTYAHAPFEFSPTNGGDSFWNTFSINSLTGAISTTPPNTLVVGTVYSASITVKDEFPHFPVAPQGSSTCQVSVKVVLDNARPQFYLTLPELSFPEMSPPQTQVYATVGGNNSLVDSDVGDVLTYSMSESPYFALDPITSRIVLDGAPLDYEELAEQGFRHQLVVRVQDLLGAQDVKSFFVRVSDVNEAPKFIVSSKVLSVPENATAGTVLQDLRLICVDPDRFANGITTFNNTVFSISSACGPTCPVEISGNFLRLKSVGMPVLDFESATKSWAITVQGTDGGNPAMFDSSVITINLVDINEAPTITAGLSFNVNEGPGGQLLQDLTFLIRDQDAVDPISSLLINITNGDPENQFLISGGKLFVRPGSILDYEANRTYTLQITVQDTVGNKATGMFSVNVQNVNDVEITGVAIVGPTTLNCNAATPILITGKNFGMKYKSPAQASVVVRYHRVVTFEDPSPPSLLANGCSVTSPQNTEITCSLPAGAGVNLVFEVSITVSGTQITGDKHSEFQTLLRYGVPTISSITGVSSIPTAGGSSFSVSISGNCFGAVQDQVALTNSLSAFSHVEFCHFSGCVALSGCVVQSPISIACTTLPAAVGNELRWKVKSLGQKQEFYSQAGSYLPPTLTASNFELPANIPTNGEPSTPFTLSGTNFGPLNMVPTRAFFVYQNTTYQFLSCKVTTPQTVVTCTKSSPGVGKNMRAYIEFGNQLSLASSFYLTFEPPTVKNITGLGASNAKTEGFQSVDIIGSNFGDVCGQPGPIGTGKNCAFVVATYSRGSVFAGTSTVIRYTSPLCAVVNQNLMSCLTAPGSGAGHVWQFTIGGIAANVNTTTTTSYASPVTTGYSGPAAKSAETNGGQIILIDGTNFGPVGGAVVSARYGNRDISPIPEFSTTQCFVAIDHIQVSCVTAPGAGAELGWVLTVDGLEGKSGLTNYKKPTLLSSSLTTYLNNDGNTTFTISGLNFGPPSYPGPYLVSSTFGPVSFSSAYAIACTVVDHELLSCKAPAGSGQNFVFSLNIKGQSSGNSAFRLSYMPPRFYSNGLLSGPRRTDGGNLALVMGEGLSLCDSYSKIRVRWREDGAISGASTRFFDITSVRNVDNTIVNPACPMGPNATIGFPIPEMDLAQNVYMSVFVTSSVTGETYPIPSSSAPEVLFQYDAPQLDSIFAEATQVAGITKITVFGKNLCKSESCCQTFLAGKAVPLANVLVHTHSKLEILGAGTDVVVQCQNGPSNKLGFSTNSPYIVGTNPQLDSFEFNAVGGQLVELWGLYFGDSTPNVTMCSIPFGTVDECLNADNSTIYYLEVVSHGPVGCLNSTRPATLASYGFDSNAQCYRTVVRTPALTGRNMPISVVRGTQSSNPDDTRFEFLSYKFPFVDVAAGTAFTQDMPTSGDGTVIFTGSNFGVLPGTVYVGSASDPILCEVSFWSDSRIECVVKDGDGRNLPIVIVQSSGNELVVPGVALNYLAPIDIAFVQDNFRTIGGASFFVSGKHLGRPGKPIIRIQNTICELITNNATMAECKFPAGEGIRWPVSVSVSGQEAVAVQVVSYAPPVIYSISPSNALPTKGRIPFRIEGDNFGVDKLRLFFDQFMVVERTLDIDPNLFRDPFIYPQTNHTHLELLLPPFFGHNRSVSVSVRGQSSALNTHFIFFEPPVLGNISVLLEDDTESTPFSSAVDFVFPAEAFSLNSSVGLNPGPVRRRMRMLQAVEQSYGLWKSAAFSPCESSVQAQKPKPLFWKYSNEIAPNGDFRRTVMHYNEGECLGPASESFRVVIEGKMIDQGLLSPDSAVSSCGLTRVYSQSVNRVGIKLIEQATLDTFSRLCSCFGASLGVEVVISAACLTSRTSCPLLFTLYGSLPISPQVYYGAYVISNDVDLWMSEPALSVAELAAKKALVYPDTPTGTVSASISTLVNSIPKGPTDGCYQWESLSAYLIRADNLILAQPGLSLTSIPRLCLRKALVTIAGSNFGEPLTASQLLVQGSQPPSLRVFLEVEGAATPVEFEATTVASPGSHGMLCPLNECFQTHDKIRFWIPYGAGRSLKIRVHVGDQSSTSSTRFSYLPPRIEQLNPGTVRLRRSFQNSEGEPILIKGKNFGGRVTKAQLLLNGKVCADTAWQNGLDDSDGRPYVSCTAPRDTVGPKSVLLCVAGQLSFTKSFKSDGPILVAGEALGAWSGSSNSYTESFSKLLRSYSLTQCPSGKTGKLYELCRDCPLGALCKDGSFTGPLSDQYFFNYEVPVRDPDTNEVTDRAIQFCSPDAYNDSLIAEYPDLVQREMCSGFLGCEPKVACIGENKCNVGYEYAVPGCMVKRGYADQESFLNMTEDRVGLNRCNVTLNPYTFEYEGNHTQCRTSLVDGYVLPSGQTCTAEREELCSKCTVFKNGENSYFGACECTLPPRCALCTIGKYFRLNNECVVCPSNVPLLIAGLIIAAILVASLGYFLSQKQVNLAMITIGIDYFQILAIFASTKVPWPETIKALFNFMTIFFINIDIAAPECLSPNLDYTTKWWLQMALPLALAGILIVVYFAHVLVKMVRWGYRETWIYFSHVSALISVMIIAMYFLYLVLTKKAFEVFNCNPVDPDDGFLYTTFTSLQCDGGGLCRCNEVGGPQQQLFPFAVILLILYTFGYPLYIAIVLKRSALLVREDQYLRAYDVGYMRKTNPDCYDMRKRYSKLYYQFKPRYAPFWILVLLMRKFWIAFAFIIFRGNPSFQLAVVLLVLFTSIVFQVLWRPFLSTGDKGLIMRELDAMAERSVKESVFSEYREIQKRVQECITLNVEYNRRQKQNRTGVQLFNKEQIERGNNLGMEMVAKESKVPRSVAAARWFTNLNTLEFILLGCSSLLCLAGIMFEASAKDNRSLVKAQVEFVTGLTIFIVIFSLVYYALFFIAEVSPACMSTLISLFKKKKEAVEDEYYDPNINLRENPMFAAPKVEFADNRALQAELDAQVAQLKSAEAQNKRLREELKKKKQETQLEETARQKATGLDIVKPATQRKEFTQTKLNQALVGPNRQRARGGKKNAATEDGDDLEEELDTQKKGGVFHRMSMAFARPTTESIDQLGNPAPSTPSKGGIAHRLSVAMSGAPGNKKKEFRQTEDDLL